MKALLFYSLNALVLGAVLAAVACSKNDPAGPDFKTGYTRWLPLAAGNTWVYAVRIEDDEKPPVDTEYRFEVTSVEAGVDGFEKVYTIAVTSQGMDVGPFTLANAGGDRCYAKFVEWDFLLSDDAERWVDEAYNLINHIPSYLFGENVSVHVPAGDFSCKEVYFEDRDELFDPITGYEYYAPDVGLVKYYIQTLHFSGSMPHELLGWEKKTYSLKEYVVAPPPAY